MLTVTQALRKLGVVGKFVEFYGPGIAALPLADRATISITWLQNTAPPATQHLPRRRGNHLCATLRPHWPAATEQIRLVEAYYKEQGLFHTESSPEAEYTQTLELDLATVEPSLAGPKHVPHRTAYCSKTRQQASHSNYLRFCPQQPSPSARAPRKLGSALALPMPR